MSKAQDEPASNGMVIDMHVIESLRELGGEDDPGLLLELIDMYLSDAPARLREVEVSLASGDIATLERAAHTLKSSSANLGAHGLATICKKIEELARTKQTTGIAPLLKATNAAFVEVETALRAITS